MIHIQKLPLFVLLSAMVLAVPAAAQTTTTEEPAPEAEVQGGLSLGEEVEPQDQIGQTYIGEVFGDWEMRCLRTTDGLDPCNLYQLLKNEQGNSVAEISVFDLPAGQQAVLGATVVTPLETLLTGQVTLSIDDSLGKRYPFNHCSVQGCFSRIGLTAEDVDKLKKGVAATLAIVPLADPTALVKLHMSLTGFTAGIKAVVDANANIPE